MRAFIDAHVHFRQGEMSAKVIPYSSRCCDAVIAMPNTRPSLETPDQIQAMHNHYQWLAGSACNVHMTAKLTPSTTPEMVTAAAPLIIGYKLYPAGVTSHSDDGIPGDWLDGPPDQLMRVIAKMEELDLVLMHHGVHPHAYCQDGEATYIEFLYYLRREFPALRMTLEHVSTATGVDFVRHHEKMFGTITLHHYLYDLDVLHHGAFQAHMNCKPMYGRPEDCDEIRKAVREPKFGLGTDSAPWLDLDKYKFESCSGVFSAPVMAELIKQLNLGEDFTSGNAAAYYGLDLPDRQLEFIEEPWTVPISVEGITPMMAGEVLKWQVR